MNENENLQPVEKLTPFTKMVMSIGTLPSSFYASMSYYESMVWLYEYLKNEVIPTVNGNAEAVEELQEKYIEFTSTINETVETLETYMNNYFTNLDVQQEINNKLDAMATDGTLTNLIKGYVDPIYEAYEGRIDESVSGLTTRVSAVENTVAAIETDGPIFVDSTDDMTDTSKVYILTTNGNVYTYSGSAWVDSGYTYGVNDLLFTGVPTAVSSTSQLADFNNAVPNRCYCVSATNIPHQPAAVDGTLITFNRNVTGDTMPSGFIQIFITTTELFFYRIFWGGSWHSWNKIAKDSDLSVFFTGMGTTALTDLNNAIPNRCYGIFDTTGVSNLPVNKTGTLITFNRSQTSNANGHIQYFIESESKGLYYRQYWSNSWSSWYKVIRDSDLGIYFTGVASNSITDLNNATPNRCFAITDTTGVSNLPVDGTGTLITFNRNQTTTTNGYVQYYIKSFEPFEIYYRLYWSNAWKPWKKLLDVASNENTSYAYASVSAFQKMGVIGDSYASGVVYSDLEHSTNNYAISWPQILARKNGITAINFSRGGLRCDTWLNSPYGLTLLNSSAAQNLYVVALGLNDATAIDNNTISLGTIADINTSDPSQNANTFYGNYGKIVSAIKTKAPNAKIILSTISYVRTETHRTLNTAIKAIADLFNIVYIEPNNSPLFTSAYFTNELVSNHPTVSGYSGMAQVYETYINDCMVSNYSYFKDYTDDTMED